MLELLNQRILLIRVFSFLSHSCGVCSEVQSRKNLLSLIVMEATFNRFKRWVTLCHTLLNIRYLLNMSFSSVFQYFVD